MVIVMNERDAKISKGAHGRCRVRGLYYRNVSCGLWRRGQHMAGPMFSVQTAWWSRLFTYNS
jgi:hypothetical protein